MSHCHINAARDARQRYELAPAVAHVLLVIATRVDADGCAFPSVPGLMDDTGHGGRTVRRAIQSLEEMGLLEIDRRPGRLNRYRVVNPLPSDPGSHDNPLLSDPGSLDQGSSDPGSHGTTPGVLRQGDPGSYGKGNRSSQNNEQSAPAPERDDDPLAAVIGSPEVHIPPHVAAVLERVRANTRPEHPAFTAPDPPQRTQAEADALFVELGARHRARTKAGYRVVKVRASGAS